MMKIKEDFVMKPKDKKMKTSRLKKNMHDSRTNLREREMKKKEKEKRKSKL